MLFATFVGYLAAGVPGALAATLFVFLPSFVFVFRGARYVEQVSNNRPVQVFLSGVIAAVVGVILVVSLDLTREAIVCIAILVVAAISFVSIVVFKVDVAKLAAGAILCGILYVESERCTDRRLAQTKPGILYSLRVSPKETLWEAKEV